MPAAELTGGWDKMTPAGTAGLGSRQFLKPQQASLHVADGSGAGFQESEQHSRPLEDWHSAGAATFC